MWPRYLNVTGRRTDDDSNTALCTYVVHRAVKMVTSLVVFLWLCGLFLTAAATCLLLGVPENLIAATTVQPAGGGDDGGVLPDGYGGSTSIEGVEDIWDKYSKLVDICSLPAVHALVFYLAMMEVSAEDRRALFSAVSN